MGSPVAVLADIHGNSWALAAVLADIERRGIEQLVGLGDVYFGPLDPAGTDALLRPLDIPTVRGNQDRAMVSPADADRVSPTWQHTDAALTGAARADLEALPATCTVGPLFLCHGTPARDDVYLVEEVTTGGVGLRSGRAIAADLAGVDEPIVLCGHSHVPRLVELPDGQLVLNPGSIGLPAYTADAPHPHAMEAGSAHARYAVVSAAGRSFRVEHVAVPYDVRPAVAAASAVGRDDWARWLATGRG